MKYFLPLVFVGIIFANCSGKKKSTYDDPDLNHVVLHSDTINVVKLSDTMVIFESTCRGCKYEASTHFAISDSLGIIKLDRVRTTDNNSSDMAGGSVSKTLILVPVKTGKTTFKMYKFWDDRELAKDSANPASYTVDVRN